MTRDAAVTMSGLLGELMALTTNIRDVGGAWDLDPTHPRTLFLRWTRNDGGKGEQTFTDDQVAALRVWFIRHERSTPEEKAEAMVQDLCDHGDVTLRFDETHRLVQRIAAEIRAAEQGW